MEFNKGEKVADLLPDTEKVIATGMHFIVYPDNDVLRLYLANNTSLTVSVDFSVTISDNVKHLNINCDTRSITYLDKLSLDSFNDNPRFEFIVTDKKANNSVKYPIKIRKSNYFKKLVYNDVFGGKVYLVLVYKELKTKLEEVDLTPLRRSFNKKSLPTSKKNSQKEDIKSRFRLVGTEVAIDLHIEKLLPDHQSMSNFEIINYQINYLHTCINESIINDIKKLSVIHGLGKGVLRQRVHEVLKEYEQVEYFVNQYDPKYGFGATFVFFK